MKLRQLIIYISDYIFGILHVKINNFFFNLKFYKFINKKNKRNSIQ